MSNPRTLIIGGNGMLGSAFVEALSYHELMVAGRCDFAGLDAGAIVARICDAGADVVINCAADTNVESAEDAPRHAMRTNAVLPKIIARACRKRGSLLVHFSSTGCYGTYKSEPYTDSDPLAPTTVHHRSKAAGERAIRNVGCDHLILRLGWLYGGQPGQRKNFVWARLIEALGRTSIQSNPYQVGCPTFTSDVVRQTQALIRGGVRGTLNCVARGRASRLDYVKHIISVAELPVEVKAHAVSRRAPVSPNEAAVNAELDRLGLNIMGDWTESLTPYVHSLSVESVFQDGRSPSDTADTASRTLSVAQG